MVLFGADSGLGGLFGLDAGLLHTLNVLSATLSSPSENSLLVAFRSDENLTSALS